MGAITRPRKGTGRTDLLMKYAAIKAPTVRHTSRALCATVTSFCCSLNIEASSIVTVYGFKKILLWFFHLGGIRSQFYRGADEKGFKWELVKAFCGLTVWGISVLTLFLLSGHLLFSQPPFHPIRAEPSNPFHC